MMFFIATCQSIWTAIRRLEGKVPVSLKNGTAARSFLIFFLSCPREFLEAQASPVDGLRATFEAVAALPGALVDFFVVAAAAIVARTTVALYLHARWR